MRVFVTGASGYIGWAVVKALLSAEHRVTGLVRDELKAARLRREGADPLLGDIQDPEGWKAVAAEHDGMIHLGFAAGPKAVATDLAALTALLDAARSGAPHERAVVYTSGIWVLGNTGDDGADESAPVEHPAAAVAWRPAHERMVLDAQGEKLATVVIRPGIVFGGQAGLVSPFFASAVREGAAIYTGDGKNRWSMVHREDLAQLYCRVIERRLRGVFHGVDGHALRVADVARAASEAAGRGGAVRSLPLPEARASMGPLADALCLDQVVRTSRAHEAGWKRRHRSFVEEAGEAWEEWARDGKA